MLKFFEIEIYWRFLISLVKDCLLGGKEVCFLLRRRLRIRTDYG